MSSATAATPASTPAAAPAAAPAKAAPNASAGTGNQAGVQQGKPGTPAVPGPSGGVAPNAGAVTPAAPATGEEVQPKSDKADERFSRSFAKLQQQDKALQAERAKFAEERKAAETEIAAAREAKDSAELLKKDPAAWLDKYGGQDTYNRLTKWRIEGKQPIEEQVKTALEEAASVKKALEEERAARAADKKAAEEATINAQRAAQITEYTTGFTEKFDARDRAIAKFFETPDLNTAAVAFAKEEMTRLQKEAIAEHGELTPEAAAGIEKMLTHDAIAGRVKEILAAKLEELKSSDVLREILAPAPGQKPTAAVKPQVVPASKPNQAPALTNALTASTSTSSTDLTPEERRRLAIKRLSGS